MNIKVEKFYRLDVEWSGGGGGGGGCCRADGDAFGKRGPAAIVPSLQLVVVFSYNTRRTYNFITNFLPVLPFSNQRSEMGIRNRNEIINRRLRRKNLNELGVGQPELRILPSKTIYVVGDLTEAAEAEIMALTKLTVLQYKPGLEKEIVGRGSGSVVVSGGGGGGGGRRRE